MPGARTWSAVLLSALLVVGAAAQSEHPSEREVEQEMLRRANRERVKAGLPELKPDERLAEAARAHSRLMLEHRELTHQLPGEPELKVRIGRTGERFDSVAENVSVTDAPDPAISSHNGLMNSPGHRANILSRGSNAMGVGVVRRGDSYWITEDFAHAFPALAADDLERDMLRQLNAERRRNGMRVLAVTPFARPDRVCRDNASPANLVDSIADARNATIFTTWTKDLPRAVYDAAVDRGIQAVAIHVCAEDAGQFKVAVVFF